MQQAIMIVSAETPMDRTIRERMKPMKGSFIKLFLDKRAVPSTDKNTAFISELWKVIFNFAISMFKP